YYDVATGNPLWERLISTLVGSIGVPTLPQNFVDSQGRGYGFHNPVLGGSAAAFSPYISLSSLTNTGTAVLVPTPKKGILGSYHYASQAIASVLAATSEPIIAQID